MKFNKVEYSELNGRQKEVHNLHHIAARLAVYGYASYPIRDDWNGGDMIARHMVDPALPTLTIQVKSRMTFDKKYMGQKLWIAFPLGADIYLFPHDKFLEKYLAFRKKQKNPLERNNAWTKDGHVSWGKPTSDLLRLLRPYRLSP